MLQETRKLIDFEMLKPEPLIRLFKPDFDLKETLTGLKDKLKSPEKGNGDE